MTSYVVVYAIKCRSYQIHADFIHQSIEYLHPTATFWPFEMWGIDIIVAIFLSSIRGHMFILAIKDYFSNWTEAIPLTELKTSDAIKFIKHCVIYYFGVLGIIIHDNGTQFASQSFFKFCNKYQIESMALSLYYPTTMD